MQYLPTMEIDRDAARRVWPRHAGQLGGAGWRVCMVQTDVDRIRGIYTAKDAARVFAADAARLNAAYGEEIYRAGSVVRASVGQGKS